MDGLEALRTRRTIRKYSSQPVEFEKVVAVCEAGTLAPSSGNLQNWRFIVITEKDQIRNSLYECCLEQEPFRTAQIAIVVCADEELVERHYGLRGKRLYSIQNCAAAMQNMLLAAHELGLGASWVGAFNEERLRSILEIPDRARPQGVITLGYPDEEATEKRMRSVEDVIRWGKYGSRYKDVHKLLGDLSVEWQKKTQKAKERMKEPAQQVMEKCKDFLGKCQDMVKEGFQNVKDKREKP